MDNCTQVSRPGLVAMSKQYAAPKRSRLPRTVIGTRSEWARRWRRPRLAGCGRASWLHRFPSSHDQVAESVAILGPLEVIPRDVARARWHEPPMFVEPDGMHHPDARPPRREADD